VCRLARVSHPNISIAAPNHACRPRQIRER
jgi:hypothetical protein